MTTTKRVEGDERGRDARQVFDSASKLVEAKLTPLGKLCRVLDSAGALTRTDREVAERRKETT
jgi:hypothetical protein